MVSTLGKFREWSSGETEAQSKRRGLFGLLGVRDVFVIQDGLGELV